MGRVFCNIFIFRNWCFASAGLFCVHLEFQPKMIYRHSTGFLCYTSVLKNSFIMLGLPNAPWNLLLNY
jgi:hypothetical protein